MHLFDCCDKNRPECRCSKDTFAISHLLCLTKDIEWEIEGNRETIEIKSQNTHAKRNKNLFSAVYYYYCYYYIQNFSVIVSLFCCSLRSHSIRKYYICNMEFYGKCFLWVCQLANEITSKMKKQKRAGKKRKKNITRNRIIVILSICVFAECCE